MRAGRRIGSPCSTICGRPSQRHPRDEKPIPVPSCRGRGRGRGRVPRSVLRTVFVRPSARPSLSVIETTRLTDPVRNRTGLTASIRTYRCTPAVLDGAVNNGALNPSPTHSPAPNYTVSYTLTLQYEPVRYLAPLLSFCHPPSYSRAPQSRPRIPHAHTSRKD